MAALQDPEANGGAQNAGSPPLDPNALPWAPLAETNEWVQRIVLLYGPSGSGKTRLAAQFPKPLLLSCDPGTIGGATSAIEFKINQMKINDYDQAKKLVDILKKSAGVHFQTLIIDSLSYLGKIVMRAVLLSSGREIPRFEEYNLNYARTAMLINNFAELKCHIVFTAVDKFDKDEVTGKIMGGPELVGKLQKELPQACDVVARLFTQTGYDSNGKIKTTYKFRTVPDDMYVGKDRTNLMAKEGDTNIEAFNVLFREDELSSPAAPTTQA